MEDPDFVQLIYRVSDSTFSSPYAFTVVLEDDSRLKKPTLKAIFFEDAFLELLETIDLAQAMAWLNRLTVSSSDQTLVVNRLLYKVHGGITVHPNESLPLALHKEVIENGHILEGLIEDAFKSRLGVVKK